MSPKQRTPNSETKFYLVRSRSLWGDFGQILFNGMFASPYRVNGRLQIQRTGPFMPPVTFPGTSSHLLVTDEYRAKLAKSGLGRFRFKRVLKVRIVDLNWEEWELGEEMPQLPRINEPEDLILERPHSEMLAHEMGDIWEVILAEGATVDTKIERAPWDYDVRVHLKSWNGDQVFWGRRPDIKFPFGTWIIATEKGKNWLEETAGEWVRFQQLPTK